jgi:anti-anti-sigma factor
MSVWQRLKQTLFGETPLSPLPEPGVPAQGEGTAKPSPPLPSPAPRRAPAQRPTARVSPADLDNTKITITSHSPGAPSPTFLRLEGNLNSVTADELEEKLQSFIENGEVNLVVDFSGVPYVSSRGWGILISVVQAVRKQGGDIKIAGMCSNVLRLFYQTGLSSIFEIYAGSTRQHFAEEER